MKFKQTMTDIDKKLDAPSNPLAFECSNRSACAAPATYEERFGEESERKPGAIKQAKMALEANDDLMKIVDSRARAARAAIHGHSPKPQTAQDVAMGSIRAEVDPEEGQTAHKDQIQSPSLMVAVGIADEEGEPIVPETAPIERREPAVMMGVGAYAAPGAYSGSCGERFERLTKIENCGQLLEENQNSHTFNTDSTCFSCGGGHSATMALEEALNEEASQSTNKSLLEKPLLLAAAAGFILLLLAFAIPVAVIQSQQTQGLTMQEPYKPSDTPNKAGFDLSLVPDMTNDTLQALADPLSQQARAYDWISRDPNWGSYKDWRKQQRFALMCLYYAFQGKNGMAVRFDPRYNAHECSWMPARDICEGNQVKSISVVRHLDIVFTGSIPPEIGFLSGLRRIHLKWLDLKPLEDMLPLHTLNRMPPIQDFLIEDCTLGGSIPPTIGLLTSLTSLQLSNAGVDSIIPSELGLLSDLSSLALQSNEFTGTIPAELGELPLLSVFNIEDNPRLEPVIPPGFCADNRIPFSSFQSDWCSFGSECCPP